MKKQKRLAAAALALAMVCLSGCGTGAAKETSSADHATLFQVALLQNLTQGDYAGSVDAKTLKQRGDTGIGTFDGLNGELIMVDGTIYRAAGDGSVEAIKDEETIPFADVTFFDEDETEELSNVDSFESLLSLLDQRVEELGANHFYVVRIHGHFSEMNVRSEYAQSEPYEPLAKVLETDQTFFDYQDIDGTAVGLYCPSYMDGINTPGWHLHFVSDDHQKGGHIIGMSIDKADLSWDRTQGFQMLLPDSQRFMEYNFNTDQTEEIEKVEKPVK
jgi:acetolactate decarboxylase